MFLMFSSRHVKGEYQRLLKMFPVFAENGGIPDAAHFFKNSELNLHSFAAERMLSKLYSSLALLLEVCWDSQIQIDRVQVVAFLYASSPVSKLLRKGMSAKLNIKRLTV